MASETLLRGNGRRDQLRALFLAIVGSEPTWSERIQAAYGTAKTPAELSQALLDLGTIGKELLASRDVGISERRKDSGLTTTLLDEIAKLAKDVKALGGAAVSYTHLDVYKRQTQGMVKSVGFGCVLTLIACQQGYNASGGAKGVGVATTRSVVGSFVTILVLDCFLTDMWRALFTKKG